MRRLLLGSVVLFIAACGGGVRPDGNAIPTDSGTAVFIQGLVAQFGEDAVDACLAAWQEALVDPSDAKDPTDKPAQGFRAFVVECLRGSAGSGGGDLHRTVGGGDIRNASPSMRSNADR